VKKEANIFVQFLMTLFGLYALTIMILSFFIVMPCYVAIFTFASIEKAPFKAHKVSRFWANLLFTCFFIRLDIKGKNLIDPNKPYVFVCNHYSQMDIPLIARACSNTFRFLSKVEVTKIPLIGYVVKRLYITVDRKSKEDRAKSFTKMSDSLLKEKISIVIFPEGTRNRTDKPLIDFKDGAFRLAVETQVPIAILTIINSGEFSPANKFMQLKPGTLKAVWTEPIPTLNMTMADTPKLKEQVRQRILGILSQQNA
jgi:1-acyl-sn-glycerol-3-phosphate acyltransferase